MQESDAIQSVTAALFELASVINGNGAGQRRDLTVLTSAVQEVAQELSIIRQLLEGVLSSGN